MGNPALEEFFGRPQTIERLSEALQQASTGLTELKGSLDAEVSGLVPSSWDGQGASAVVQHWQQQSAMTLQVSQQTQSMSTAMRVLAVELQAALSTFQSAEIAAETNGCYITPFYMVLPYSWWDLEAVAAMEFIQAEVVASMVMAETARVQAAAAVLGIWAEPGGWAFLKDLGSGLVAGLEELWQTVELAAKLSPQRAMVDPMGWFHDEVDLLKGEWQAIQHPGEILKKLVDWEDWTNGHPGRAIGKLAPMVIITALTAGGGAAADGAVVTGEVTAEATVEAAGTTVAKEVAEASTVKAVEVVPDLSTRQPWWGPGWESGPPPKVELGEIKPIKSYDEIVEQLSERPGVDTFNTGAAVFDNQGNVVYQVFDKDGNIIWEDHMGKIDPLPSVPPETTEFGNAMEAPVRDLLSQRTGQEFLPKASNAPGPDLVPK